MGIHISWQSQQGKRTSDNRDYGGIGIRRNAALCVLLDGSTSAPESGDLVRQMTLDLIDWYVTTPDGVTVETLTARVRHAHEKLFKMFPSGSASYVILHAEASKPVLVLHAGDCLLGWYDGRNPIRWLTQPHTLANVAAPVPIDTIAKVPARHLLTRSFRAREFMLPEATEIQREEGSLLLAGTDGFWAELDSEKQGRFIAGCDLAMPDEGDDRSVLKIRFLDGNSSVECETATPANLYVNRNAQR